MNASIMRHALFLLIIFSTILPTGLRAFSCCPREYECALNPLYCDAWSVQVYTGVAPITWTKRQSIQLVSCETSATSPLLPIAEHFPNFSHLYKVPWIIGGILGYAWTENTEIFGEVNYLQARPKHTDTGFVLSIPNSSDTVAFALEKYRLVDAYVGVRYYFDRCWCNLSWFLGGKVGLTHHKATKGALVVNCSFLCDSFDCACDNTPTNFFNLNNVVSGGLIAGFDYCLCNNWSLILNFEVIASCGPRFITNSFFETPLPIDPLPTNLLFDGIGTELRFPLALGLKYSF